MNQAVSLRRSIMSVWKLWRVTKYSFSGKFDLIERVVATVMSEADSARYPQTLRLKQYQHPANASARQADNAVSHEM